MADSDLAMLSDFANVGDMGTYGTFTSGIPETPSRQTDLTFVPTVTPRTPATLSMPGESPVLHPSSSGSQTNQAKYRSSRKSEPGRGAMSAATVPSPLRRRSLGWEYPMSREEKKQRIMCLYEAELAEAQRHGRWQGQASWGAAQIDENEEEQADEARQATEAPLADPARERVPPLPLPPRPSALPPALPTQKATKSPRGVRPAAASAAAVGVALLLLAVGLVMGPLAARAPAAPEAAPAAAPGATALPARPSSEDRPAGGADCPENTTATAGTPLRAAPAAVAVDPVTLAAVGSGSGHGQAVLPAAIAAGLQAGAVKAQAASARQSFYAGLAKMKVSNCRVAEQLFLEALRLWPENATEEAATSGKVVGRVDVESNIAFALICMHHFVEGATRLERILNGTTVSKPNGTSSSKSSPLFMNALGYARFHLKNYAGAVDAFEAATKLDSWNPILWNNLGAARMQTGNIIDADDAMWRAVDQTEPGGKKHYILDEYYRRVFLENVQRLSFRASWTKDSAARGLELGLPQVELWWDEAWQ